MSPTGHLSADAKLALDNMWALQIKAADMNGAWAWLQFHNAPFEGDSQFYGNSLAAMPSVPRPEIISRSRGFRTASNFCARGWSRTWMRRRRSIASCCCGRLPN